jgi:hypothetical protein
MRGSSGLEQGAPTSAVQSGAAQPEMKEGFWMRWSGRRSQTTVSCWGQPVVMSIAEKPGR